MSVVLNPEQTQVVEEIREKNPIDIEGIGSYTIADAIRRGAEATDKTDAGWGRGKKACALHAAALDAVATGYIQTDE